jgi:hypothetical protein
VRRAAVAAAVACACAPAAVRAQDAPPPPVISACWVPGTGAVYRVDPGGQTAGLPRACLSAAHRPFEWSQQGPKGDRGEQGAPGPAGAKGETGPPGRDAALPVYNADFYDLSGPTAPSAGFVSQGTVGEGSTAIPRGAGARLLWYARKAAFRAGAVSGDEWDEERIGENSIAMGFNTIASGRSSIALGSRATADANLSTAIGSFVGTGGMVGSMVLGDASTTRLTEPDAPNQLLARFAGGYRLRTNRDLSAGCDISPAGRLTCTGGAEPAYDQASQAVWSFTLDRAPTLAEPARFRLSRSCPDGRRGIAGGISHRDFNDGQFDVLGSASPAPGTRGRTWHFVAWNTSSTQTRVALAWITCVPD